MTAQTGRARRTGLRRRLLLVVLPVAAISVILTAIVVQQITKDQLQDQVSADLDEVAFIHTALNEEAAIAATWRDAEPIAVDLATEFDVRIVLIDIDGKTLLDTAELIDGESRPLPTQSAGYIDPSFAAFDLDLPAEFEESLQAEEDYERCLADLDIDDSVFDDVAILEDYLLSESDLELLDRVDQCWELAFSEFLDIDPASQSGDFAAPSFGLEPALLFLGEPGPPSDVLDASIDYRMVLSIVTIGAIAILATYAASRPILAPISALTKAADQVASGGRPEPVTVTGGGELSALAEAFNSMGSTLRYEEEARRQLTTDIAHELRSPLQNIRGTLEAAQDGVRELDRELVDSVHEEALFLQHLVDDLQILALADAAKLHLDHDIVDLGDLISSVARSQSDRAVEQGIVIQYSQSEPGLAVAGDRIRLRQVLTNLIDNALRHTPPGGRVDIDIVRTQPTLETERVQISVRDTGEGIAEEFLPHVFERFTRADPSRTRGTGGSGVGLAICQKLIEAHQGTISATSHIGVGTTFVIDLPAAAV